MADAAHAVFLREAKGFTGHFLIDDTVLSEEGVTDFSKYRVTAGVPLAPDFFVPDTSVAPPGALD
jgi:citronellol/citronellal dehydrogenase